MKEVERSEEKLNNELEIKGLLEKIRKMNNMLEHFMSRKTQ